VLHLGVATAGRLFVAGLAVRNTLLLVELAAADTLYDGGLVATYRPLFRGVINSALMYTALHDCPVRNK